jgi:hypothetical protein
LWLQRLRQIYFSKHLSYIYLYSSTHL